MLSSLHFDHVVSTELFLAFFFIISRLFYLLVVKPRQNNLSHIPRPNQGFFLFRLLHEPTVRELEQWLDELPHKGLIRYYGLWNQERIFAASPEAVKDLLVSGAYQFVKPELQRLLAGNVAAEGLLLQEGTIHKAARKAFQPAFHADHIRRAYPIMWETAFDLVNAVTMQTQAQHADTSDKTGSKEGIGLLKPLSAASIDIIGRWGFSKDFNAVQDPSAKFGRTYIQILKTTKRGQGTLHQAAIIGPKLALQLPLRAIKTIRRGVALVVKTAETIVQEHEQSQDTNSIDMLGVAMKSGHFSHSDLVVQTVHMLAAGTETVSGSVSWAIHLLSRHPEMQTRLREEIRQQLPSPRSINGHLDLQEADFAGTKYLDAVIKEVLRFHSINTILWRECVSPARILDTVIPVGAKVVFSPWALGRDPNHWGPDARTFNPDRWLDENREQGVCDNVLSFLTFGAGPRRCIGEQFARAQMRCLIAGLVGRFEFSPLAPERESDDGLEIGDQAALTLFKIFEDWKIQATEIEGW
ncbi:hypothetical protein M409DRAFT_36899 [Zasmidium cellare ATCC 36951]|uniref:Cytochrome P450 n=1 Tax=Zasmidium cellare ATCC 36951 TaxID=1080233 RepID=A0A6A6CHH8_ZASCE|nr:uncharacterized protein M409DRAFT_36899 [Zasmidium cellare ATCC 36951]KAF2165392.1 hypothetical protein M409DRAFT_36899 [Zasmidium cellare ATCC 36951]